VHRPAYLDYVGVKKFGADGQVVGEHRFLGLYTRTAYRVSPREIPQLRGKVEGVLERAGFPPGSHDAKALLEIVESSWLTIDGAALPSSVYALDARRVLVSSATFCMISRLLGSSSTLTC
jgi:hypothetical protein